MWAIDRGGLKKELQRTLDANDGRICRHGEAKSKVTTTEIRTQLIETFRRDLVGPHPETDLDLARERLSESPSRWYLTGFLAPVDDPMTRVARSKMSTPRCKRNWKSKWTSPTLKAAAALREIRAQLRHPTRAAAFFRPRSD